PVLTVERQVPEELVDEQGCADVSFVAALLIDKFLWHLPLYRQHRHASAFLGEDAGTLVSDGYGACEACVEAIRGAVRHKGCWIHTRRNFREQKDNHPLMAGEALALISAIYRIKEEIDGTPTDERLIARRTRSRAAVKAFRDWLLEDPALTPKHPIRKAIAYAVERRATLEVFLAVPPDTNLVENRIRNPKLGQRNWLFAWTELGAENVGIINGLLATCRMQGIDPRVWLTDVLLRINSHPARRVDELTPRRWKTLFAEEPMTSDVARVTGFRPLQASNSACGGVVPDGDVDPAQKRRERRP
ncbi:MAG: transposase, partial [Rhodobacteraceae bacterium]|nr:transposase [Paracoccaceae bacterium]